VLKNFFYDRKPVDEQALEISIRSRPDLTKVTVNSSPNAIGAYKKLGFNAVGPEQIEHGIRFIPMRLHLGKTDDG